MPPYQCTQCDKGFSNRGSLWVHVKQHEVDKPYACSECHKTFSHSSHLSVHKRLHTGEKPYRYETSFTSTKVKLRILLRFDPHLNFTITITLTFIRRRES